MCLVEREAVCGVWLLEVIIMYSGDDAQQHSVCSISSTRAYWCSAPHCWAVQLQWPPACCTFFDGLATPAPFPKPLPSLLPLSQWSSTFTCCCPPRNRPQVPPPPKMDPAHEETLHNLMEVGYGAMQQQQ